MSSRREYTSPGSRLTDAEIDALWERFSRERSQDGRDRLIEHYMPLVYQTAERMATKLPTFIDVNDLIGSGTLGLIDAINRFEPERGIKFSTYCCTRVSGAILDELRRLDWAPRLVRARVNQLDRCREELEAELGRRPNEEELASAMDMDRNQFDDLLKETQVKSMVSLDRKWDEDDDHELGAVEMMADKSVPDPLSELERAELKEVAIRGLSEKEKQVVTMYYFEDLSLKEIGMVLDLSESRVCQIHSQVLGFLKDKFHQRQIKPVMGS